ncbi:MAG: hypothetical protein ABSB49_04430 [Polyangia bacterium]
MSEPDSARGSWDSGLIHSLLDELAASYAGPAYQAEVSSAREDYFARSGKVFEDDGDLFEARTISFLEWYVLERPLRSGFPPIVDALQKAATLPAGDLGRAEALACIATSHRSLFDIAQVEADGIELEDVLGGARFRVSERRSTIGFDPGALVEARLVWQGREPVFAKTFLFHPRDARSEIIDIVDSELAAGADRDQIMFRLAQLHLRWHRHGHTNAARIYKGAGTIGPVPFGSHGNQSNHDHDHGGHNHGNHGPNDRPCNDNPGNGPDNP